MTSFRTRILLLVLGIVAVPLGGTIYALTLKAQAAARAQATTELRAGASVARETLAFRGEQLANAARVLTADFGFKEAVASGDRPTLLSAIENHGARIKADLVAVFDANGKLLAMMPSDPVASVEHQLRRVEETERGKIVYRVLDTTAYQLVSATVRAPEPIASVVIGFSLDAALARQISQVVGVDVSFASRNIGGVESMVSSGAHPIIDARDGLTALSPAGMLTTPDNKYLMQQQPLPVDQGALLIVLHSALDKAAQPYLQLRAGILIIGGSALLIALLCGAWLAQAATRPVTALTAAAERIELGDYSSELPHGGTPEFQQLGAAFTAMRAAVAEREHRIKHQAYHDTLTGLANRTRIQDIIAATISDRERVPLPFSLCLLDIVHFSDINASLGHALGDRLIRELATRLVWAAPANATVARVGLDQFLILLPDCDVDDSLLLGNELVRTMQEQIEADSIPIRLSARCGVATFPTHGRSAEELMRRADVALFSAHKNASSLAVFEPSAEQKHRRQVQVLGELQRGIEAGQLRVVYQPKIDLRTHAMHGCEALVRWRHPVHGEIPPGEFIPHAERTGSIRYLTSWVLGAVIAQLAAWNAAGRTMEVAVNLSAADIADPALASEIEVLLSRHAVHGRQLVCEITEGVAMRDVEGALRAMSRLRGLGMRFAIDDFGTGYSSLAQLSRLPVDELKLDGGLIAQLADERARMIVRAMVELGHALDLRVVAEGVETLQLMRTAAKLGCDLAQGYLYSRPLSAEDLAQWLHTRQVSEVAGLEGTPASTTRMRILSMTQRGSPHGQ